MVDINRGNNLPPIAHAWRNGLTFWSHHRFAKTLLSLGLGSFLLSCAGKSPGPTKYTQGASNLDLNPAKPLNPPDGATKPESSTIPKSLKLSIGQKLAGAEATFNLDAEKPQFVWAGAGLGFQPQKLPREIQSFKRSSELNGNWEKIQLPAAYANSTEQLLFASSDKFWRMNPAGKVVSLIQVFGNNAESISETKISVAMNDSPEPLFASESLLALKSDRSLFLLAKEPGTNKIYSFRTDIPNGFEQPIGFVVEDNSKLWVIFPGTVYFNFFNFKTKKIELQTAKIESELLQDANLRILATGKLSGDTLQAGAALIFSQNAVAVHLAPEAVPNVPEAPAAGAEYTQQNWDSQIKTLALRACADCHGSSSTRSVQWKVADSFEGWKVNPSQIAARMKTGSMPPADAPASAALSQAERNLLIGFAESAAK